MKKSLFDSVYEVVRIIPKGKVTTYGDIAKAINTRDARKVGWALHANPDKKTPCHRVVSKDGNLADSFAFGGWGEQKSMLEKEGVGFAKEKQVDLKKYLWEPDLSSEF